MSVLTNSYSFPVLELDRYDYNEESNYSVSQLDVDKSSYIVLEHKISGDNLITQLLESGEAKFITTIVLKSAMYRETLDEVETINGSNLHVKQKIPLQTTFETQSFFCGVVYIGEDREITLDANSMGLDKFWDGVTIQLLKGSIIARDGWRELESTASDLLTIRKNDTCKYSFDVTLLSEEGGKFIAEMEPVLFESLHRASKNNPHRRSIITHILCVGFMKLEKEYRSGDFESYTNFKGIKFELERVGLKTWEDGDDFDPNKVACHFLPHILPTGEEDA
jgi:hypothetical protein